MIIKNFCENQQTLLRGRLVVTIKVLIPGQVVIMDNATFHKSEKTKRLIEEAGCQLVYLPVYSPDLNPIEKYWANMKR